MTMLKPAVFLSVAAALLLANMAYALRSVPNDAVGTQQIAPGAIGAQHIAPGAVDAAIRNFLLNNPDVVYQAMKNAQNSAQAKKDRQEAAGKIPK
jgi:hypothetical protein